MTITHTSADTRHPSKDDKTVTQTVPQMTVTLGVSPAFHNKDLKPGHTRVAFGDSFQRTETTLAALAEHITSGGAYTLAAHSQQRRTKDTFDSAQLKGLDLDDNVSVQDALAHPFVSQYACFLHPSSSSTPAHAKTRVLFVKETPTKDPDRFELEQLALFDHVADLRPDPACKDSARLFFGSTVAGWVTQNKVLPDAVLDDLVSKYQDKLKAELDQQAEQGGRVNLPRRASSKQSDSGDGQPPASLVDAVVRALGIDPTDTNRRGYTRQHFSCLVSTHTHDHKDPKTAWHPDKLHTKCFKCGAVLNTWDTAAAVGIDWKDHYEKPDVLTAADQFTPHQPDTNGDILLDVPYVSADHLPDGDVYIRSDMGTGKTTLMTETVQSAPRVLVTSHRIALVSEMADRLSSPGQSVESYEGLESDDLRRLSRLAITLNSIHKLIDPDTGLVPRFDLLVLDEFEQQLSHFGGDTFSKNEASTAYEIFCQLVQRAGRVIALDAHAGQIGLDWLNKYRPGCPLLVNTHQRSRGHLTMYEDDKALTADLLKLASQPGTVAVPTNSKKHAKKLERMLTDAGLNVMCIHADNATDDRQRAFTKNINGQLSQYDVLIYTPTYGSGIDIQTECTAVCAFLFAGVLDGTECHQLINRVRHTPNSYVWVQQVSGDRPTDAADIYQQELRAARKTGTLNHFDTAGVLIFSEQQDRLHGLMARITAAKSHSLNHLAGHFVRLAGGYQSVSLNSKKNAVMGDILQNTAEQLAAEQKDRVLNADPIDRRTYDSLRQTNSLTDDSRAGHVRWKIERSAGQDITPDLYDTLHPDGARGQLYLLADVLHVPLDQLKGRDMYEAKHDYHQRRHHVQRVAVLRSMIKDVWGDAGLTPDAWLTADDIQLVLENWLELNRDTLRDVFYRRTDGSTKKLSVLRWMLDKIGLKLDSRKEQRDGQRVRVYGLDADVWDKWSALAESCQQQRELEQLEREQKQAEQDSRQPVPDTAGPAESVQNGDYTYTYIPELDTHDAQTGDAGHPVFDTLDTSQLVQVIKQDVLAVLDAIRQQTASRPLDWSEMTLDQRLACLP